MKAAVYYSQEDIRIEEVETPRIKPDEVLVEMRACGICGSDLMSWYLEKRAPLVLGHEPSGIVAKTGSTVKDFNVGDRVFVHHHVACLNCYYCRHGDYTLCAQFARTHIEPGGFAEYFKVPALNLQLDTIKLPDSISFMEATLIEPVACCLRALEKCGINDGDTIAVVGAGPSGIINATLAKHLGASCVVVSDFVEFRLHAAVEFGADKAVNPARDSLAETVKSLTDSRGADLVIVTAPSTQAFSDAVAACRRGGTLCVFAPTAPNEAVQISPHRLFFNEIRIISSYSTSHVETKKALKLIEKGVIDAAKLVTHVFPLDKIGEAFRTAAKDKNSLKVVVTSSDSVNC